MNTFSSQLIHTIKMVQSIKISQDRKVILNILVDYIQDKLNLDETINLNFICTHNSRRSHFAQIWAQVAATYYNLPKVYCYSGGTEVTSVYPVVLSTLHQAGFSINKISEDHNSVYCVKLGKNAMPIISFSKQHDDLFNPQSDFAAIMTCSQADQGCPFILGADRRISITYEDPKVADNTIIQDKVYQERSIQIASEMFYIFSELKY